MSKAKKDILLIDADLPDLQTLKAYVKDSVAVLEIGKSDDGQAAFAQALATGASRVHVVAHGSPGKVHLGKAALDRAWAEALPPANADVSFYACNLAAGHEGQAFVDAVKTKVCGSVAASAREVGHGAHAGWDLTAIAPPPGPFSRAPDAWKHTLIWYTGTSGDDVIPGSSGSDDIFGADGDDKIYGGAGGDWLQGDGGKDEVWGDSGNDNILGGTGDDILHGGTENDTLVGNEDNDELYGGSGNDFLSGDAGNDYADGGAGDDRINGDPGDDILLGGDGNDTFNYDNDTSYGPNNGWDMIHGGSGTDSIHYYEDNTTISLRYLESIEQINVHGYANAELNLVADPDADEGVVFNLSNTAVVNGTLDITITGTSFGDTLIGSAVADTINGGGGADEILALGGANTIDAGGGDDFIFYQGTSSNGDVLDGGSGFDIAFALSNNTTMKIASFTGVEAFSANGYSNVNIAGTANADSFDFSSVYLDNIASIDTGGGDDLVVGSAGADTILGGAGFDLIDGAGGADILTGGADGDAFFYFFASDSAAGAADRITDFSSAADMIHLGYIDYDAITAGDQAYTFLGTGAFTGAAGELRYQYNGVDTHVYGTGAGGITDFEVILAGNVSLSSANFLL